MIWKTRKNSFITLFTTDYRSLLKRWMLGKSPVNRAFSTDLWTEDYNIKWACEHCR
jgi:hypothetical protein